jgi:arylsulfatase A-like enzyme
VNLLPYLKGETAGKPHETLYWRFGEQWAIRHGDWKLVVGRGIKQPGLFNLADDLAEANDLAEKQPEKVQELQSLWQSWNAQQAPPSSPQEKNHDKKKNKQRPKRKPASV